MGRLIFPMLAEFELVLKVHPKWKDIKEEYILSKLTDLSFASEKLLHIPFTGLSPLIKDIAEILDSLQ